MREFKDSITGDSEDEDSEDRAALGAAPAQTGGSAEPSATHDAAEPEPEAAGRSTEPGAQRRV